MNKAELIKALAELLADKMEICEEPTNGEVIQALFPYVKTEDSYISTLIGTNLDEGYVVFQREWWDAPYQKGGE